MKSSVIQEIRKDKKAIKKENFENLFKLAIDYQISSMFGKKSFRLKEHIDFIFDLVTESEAESYLEYIKKNMLTVEYPDKYLMAVQLILSSVEKYFWFWLEDHFPNDLMRDLLELSERFNSLRDKLAFMKFRNDLQMNREENAHSDKLVDDNRFFLYKKTREIKDYYENIIESTTDAIIATDEKGRIVLFNNGARKMLEYDPEEVFQKGIDFIYVKPEDTEKLKNLLIEKKGAVHAFETEIKSKTGKTIPALISVSLVKNKAGNTIGISRYIKNITTLKEMEKKLRHLSEFKSKYLADMSHEIKTPVSSVIGFADIILNYYEKDLDINVKKYLDKIKNAGEVLLDLLNTLLDISKIEAGKIELEYKKFNPRELIEDVKVIFLPRMADKGIDFNIICNEALPEINADKARLRQVVFNLVDNALKYTPGDGKVTFKLQSDEANIKITISDTGPGIEEKDRERVFEEFEQIGIRDKTGAGLGLAISKKLIDLHGGTIQLQSHVGVGSKFIITIPINPNP